MTKPSWSWSVAIYCILQSTATPLVVNEFSRKGKTNVQITYNKIAFLTAKFSPLHIYFAFCICASFACTNVRNDNVVHDGSCLWLDLFICISLFNSNTQHQQLLMLLLRCCCFASNARLDSTNRQTRSLWVCVCVCVCVRLCCYSDRSLQLVLSLSLS